MAADSDKPRRIEALPVEDLGLLSAEQREVLKRRWITTVDALVAVAATPPGRVGLCAALGIDRAGIEALLAGARSLLGDGRYGALSQPSPGGSTGALWDGETQPRAEGERKEDDGER